MMAYIAQKKCGCIVMACIDNPLDTHRDDTAKEVAKAIREGYTIRRVTVDFVREHWLCAKHKQRKMIKEVTEKLL